MLSAPGGYVLGAGVFLTVGIPAYIAALESGPISVVVPIYGLCIVVSTVMGIVGFDEVVTVRKVVGLVLASFSVVLVSI